MGFFNRTKWSEESFQLYLDDNELSLGQELKGTLNVKSDIEFDVEKMWVSLRCEESIAKDHETIYEDEVQVSDAMHVNVGFDKEFPFVIRLPSVGRETYQSINQKVQWLVEAYIKAKGIRNAISAVGGGFILVAKPTAASVKEVVREVVLIPCAYCSGLMPQTSTFCPNCGARRKG